LSAAVWTLRQLDPQHHVQHRAGRCDVETADNASLQAGHVVAERAQPATKQHVLLEAITATPPDDHLVLQRSEVEFRRTVE
jgi:hypothetical protein